MWTKKMILCSLLGKFVSIMGVCDVFANMESHGVISFFLPMPNLAILGKKPSAHTSHFAMMLPQVSETPSLKVQIYQLSLH